MIACEDYEPRKDSLNKKLTKVRAIKEEA